MSKLSSAHTLGLVIFQLLAITFTSQAQAAPFDKVYGNYHVAGCKVVSNKGVFDYCQYHEVSLSESSSDTKTTILEFKRNIAIGVTDKMAIGLKLTPNSKYAEYTDNSYSMTSDDVGISSIIKIKRVSTSQIILTLITSTSAGSFFRNNYHFEMTLQK